MFQFNFDPPKKCGGCGWRLTQLFVLANSDNEAKELLEADAAGLCDDCMCNLLVDNEYKIIRKEIESF